MAFAKSDKPKDIQSIPIPIPGGSVGIGFDDLTFAPSLRKVLVPSGRTGKLNLIDPQTHEITSIDGFSSEEDYQGGHGQGTTSADEGFGFLFATDRNKKFVEIVDPNTKKILASASLSADPDYVRYVNAAHEVWVTEPDAEQIEVFLLSTGDPPALKHSLAISVPGGPESLVIDNSNGHAYTHLWSGTTVAIDVKTHRVDAKWLNGCNGSRGIALDEKRGFLFVGCAEGKAAVLDLNHEGKELSSLRSGAGVDIIAYNPKLSHLYLPGATSATLSILEVSTQGKLSLLGIAKTVKGSHCAAADDQENVWACDPDHGQILFLKDPFDR